MKYEICNLSYADVIRNMQYVYVYESGPWTPTASPWYGPALCPKPDICMLFAAFERDNLVTEPCLPAYF